MRLVGNLALAHINTKESRVIFQDDKNCRVYCPSSIHTREDKTSRLTIPEGIQNEKL